MCEYKFQMMRQNDVVFEFAVDEDEYALASHKISRILYMVCGYIFIYIIMLLHLVHPCVPYFWTRQTALQPVGRWCPVL